MGRTRCPIKEETFLIQNYLIMDFDLITNAIGQLPLAANGTDPIELASYAVALGMAAATSIGRKLF